MPEQDGNPSETAARSQNLPRDMNAFLHGKTPAIEQGRLHDSQRHLPELRARVGVNVKHLEGQARAAPESVCFAEAQRRIDPEPELLLKARRSRDFMAQEMLAHGNHA